MLDYFDTNVFDFIAALGESAKAKKLLASRRAALLASEFHLLELIAIPDALTRRNQLLTLTTLATRYSEMPLPWLHAKEVRNEIGRCRSHWLRTISTPKEASVFIRRHRQQWAFAKQGKLQRNRTYDQFRQDAERGVHSSHAFQKLARKVHQSKRQSQALVRHWHDGTQEVRTPLDSPEAYWRSDNADCWSAAVVNRNPSSRDYADYLLPYLVDDAFLDPSYDKFWMIDVVGENMPRNRISGLSSFFQLQHKLGHGNSFDALHANYLLDVDLFVTADRAFQKVLCQICAHTTRPLAKPVLIDRARASAVEVIDEVLTESSSQ
jgi:hypothetical protein